MRGVRLFAIAVLAVTLAVPVAAQGGVRITTSFPAVAVEAGETQTFDVEVSAPSRQRVDVVVESLPEGWEATLRGGGYTIDAVTAGPSPSESARIQLEVQVPAGIPQEVYEVVLRASGQSGTDTLVLRLRVAEVVAGGVRMTAEFSTLRGPSDTQFRFDVDLANDTPEELSFTLSAEGPPGWQVSARPTLAERAVTVTVEGGSSSRIVVEAQAPEGTTADTYPILVRAAGGGRNAELELAVEITGTFSMFLSTADERLNVDAVAGSATEIPLLVRNTGSAPLRDVTLSASPPSGWEVEFEPASVEAIPPGESSQVIARLTPAGDALAGDYVVTLTSSVAETSSRSELRVTVNTSRLWGFIGLLLIAAAIGGLFWVFRRYGRR